MPNQTTRWGLDRIAEGASSIVLYNRSHNLLDSIGSMAVESKTVSVIPSDPEDGQVWYVPTGATGTWAGHQGELAFFYGGWTYRTVPTGALFYVVDEDLLFYWDGTSLKNPVASSSGDQFAIHIQQPSLAFGGAAFGGVGIHLCKTGRTITEIRCIPKTDEVSGTHNVVWNLEWGTTRTSIVDTAFDSNQATNAVDGEDVRASFDVSSIPINNYVWLKWLPASTSGSIDWVEWLVTLS